MNISRSLEKLLPSFAKLRFGNNTKHAIKNKHARGRNKSGLSEPLPISNFMIVSVGSDRGQSF